MKRLAVFILCAAVACMMLTACGDSYLGTWHTRSVEQDGVVINNEDEELGKTLKNYMILLLEKDGKGAVSYYGIEEEIEWSIEGDVITVKDGGAGFKAEYKNDTLVIDDGTTRIVLEK